MNYPLFISLLGSIVVIIIAGLSILLKRKDKKVLAIQLWVGLLTFILVLTFYELGVYWLAKPYKADNPWIVWAGLDQRSVDSDLPYLRKPFIDWQGLAEGDLAVLNGDRDPYARWVNYKTDKEGFRNHREITQADIIVLGDSYTEAGNVAEEESYVYQLGQISGKTTKNLGLSGYTTPYEALIFANFGRSLQPKIVILQVAESNDLREGEDYYHWIKAGKPASEPKPVELGKEPSWRMRSLTYRWYRRCFPYNLAPFPLQGVQTDSLGNKLITRFLQPPGYNMRPEGHLGWGIMKGVIMRMAEVCKASDIQLLIALIPDKIHVLGDHVHFDPEVRTELEAYPAIPQDESLAHYLEILCKQSEILFADLSPALKKGAEQGKLVYLPLDTHLAPDGHKIIAEELARNIP